MLIGKILLDVLTAQEGYHTYRGGFWNYFSMGKKYNLYVNFIVFQHLLKRERFSYLLKYLDIQIWTSVLLIQASHVVETLVLLGTRLGDSSSHQLPFC